MLKSSGAVGDERAVMKLPAQERKCISHNATCLLDAAEHGLASQRHMLKLPTDGRRGSWHSVSSMGEQGGEGWLLVGSLSLSPSRTPSPLAMPRPVLHSSYTPSPQVPNVHCCLRSWPGNFGGVKVAVDPPPDLL
jgi:hypothetical protein